jgi:hypothetical protein
MPPNDSRILIPFARTAGVPCLRRASPLHTDPLQTARKLLAWPRPVWEEFPAAPTTHTRFHDDEKRPLPFQ